jgi:hypothetical protein
MRSRSLIIALLLAAFLVPAAGAIYIPGQVIPNDGQPHILLADSGSGSSPMPDTDGPIKRYLSDDPNDYVLVPGNDPDMMYALGESPMGPDEPVAISAPKVISTDKPSYVTQSPPVPAFRSVATAANTGTETVMPPDFFAPENSFNFNPSVTGLQHANLASIGYDVSKIGSIAMPSIKAGMNTAIPEFRFPALFG